MLNQNNFVLNSRLKNDTYLLKETVEYFLLLSKNAHFLWFVLVPKTDKIEFVDLDFEKQKYFLDEINKVSNILKNNFKVDKLNIATIGNVVSQMHIHVVGRFKNDICFPDPMWGCEKFKDYSKDEVLRIKKYF
jgi:diadenosine tetraphosphate (Ap4A) HIT family hydrolase